jgi:2-polyprenyl-3-methyl-5-hydroxy-6-metoxy-1,4-benzoquinol methylase
MTLGREQRYHLGRSTMESAYILLFGIPIVGLRIRARNVFGLIPKDREYRRILDVGSGPGVFAFELGRRFPQASVLGIDPLEETIKACSLIAKKIQAVNIRFRKASIDQILEENTFDLILCVDILEHIDNDIEALIKIFNVAAPDGILVLHVPALYRRYPVWKKSLNFDVETHVRTGYEPGEIRNKVRDAGFSITASGFTYGFWETLANNVSYMITRAKMKNKGLYSLAFPVLNGISLLGARARPRKLGAGIFVVAKKRSGHHAKEPA